MDITIFFYYTFEVRVEPVMLIKFAPASIASNCSNSSSLLSLPISKIIVTRSPFTSYTSPSWPLDKGLKHDQKFCLSISWKWEFMHCNANWVSVLPQLIAKTHWALTVQGKYKSDQTKGAIVPLKKMRTYIWSKAIPRKIHC